MAREVGRLPDARHADDTLAEPVNLHVSAQLGEWPASQESPEGPSSTDWWQIDGWYGVPARFNGYQEGNNGRRARFLAMQGLELVIGKERFGIGDWSLRFNLGGLGDDGLLTGEPRVTFEKSWVRESRTPRSVRAKPNGLATRPTPSTSLEAISS